MDEKQLQFLFNEYAKGKGFKDFSEFKGLMDSEPSRKMFFEESNKELGFKDYNEFNDLLGLKKKVSGVASVPTESKSALPGFLEEGKKMAQVGFATPQILSEDVKARKEPKAKLSIEPSFPGVFGSVPKVKVLEETEDPSFLANLTSAGIKGQIQGKVANILSAGRKPVPEELGEIAQLQSEIRTIPQSKAERTFQEKGLAGLFKESPLLGAEFIAETMVSSLSALVESSKKTVPAGVVMGAAAGAPFAGIGALPGALTGIAAGQTAAGYNLSTSGKILEVLSKEGVDITNKESLINAFSDEEKMSKIRTTAAKYGIPIAVIDGLTGGLAGKLAAGAVGRGLARKLAAGFGEAGIQVAGGASGDLAGQLASGQKVNWDDVMIEGLAAVPGGATEVVSGVTMERAKASSNNKTLATQIATQGSEDGAKDAIINLNRDLQNNVITPEDFQDGVNFIVIASTVNQKIPENIIGENRAESIELLAERDAIKQTNQDLMQQKQNVDEAYHAGIDAEIKSNEDRIKKIDTEVYDIAKKPSEEISEPQILEGQMAEAPIEEIVSEVKPTEVKELGKKSVEELEKRQAEIEDAKTGTPEREEFNKIDKELEEREWRSVFDAPIEKVSDVVDALMKKEKEMPNGFGSYMEPMDARLTKDVANRYSKENASRLTDAEVIKDFKDAMFGNPMKSYADGLKLREAINQSRERGIDVFEELSKEFVKDGYSKQDAIDMAKRKLEPLLKSIEPAKELKKIESKVEAPKQQLDQENRSYITKTGRQRVEYEKGILVVRDAKTGKEVSDVTRRKAIDEYIDNFNFEKGERSYEIVTELPSGLNEEEGKRFIVENSKNPLEVVEIYAAEPKESKLTTEEQMIADYGLGKLKQAGFERFGDPNLITGGMARTYFNKEGAPIDVVAKEMSDYYEKEITPQDIIDFMTAYPSGASQAVRMGETRVAIEAAQRFKDLTGVDLNSKVAERIIDAEIAKAEAFEQELIKQEYETREQLEEEYYRASAEADRLAEEGNRPTAQESEKTGAVEAKKEVTLQDIYESLPKSEKLRNKQIESIVNRDFESIIKQLEKYKEC